MSNQAGEDDPAEDVLAAEAFAVPAADPSVHDDPAVDVLAAEEFAVPAPDPALRPESLNLPADLVGDEPREVLAAEEFAMPAPDEAHEPPPAPRRRRPGAKLIAACLLPVGVVLGVWRRKRRHRTAG